MNPSPDLIDVVLGMIAERRDALTNLEAALLDVRRVFGQPFVVPLPAAVDASRPALPAPAARVPTRQLKANVAPPAPTFGPKPRARRQDIGPRVLSFLSDQASPVMFAQIVTGIGGGNKAYIRDAINTLVDAGQVVRHGVKAGQTIGLPKVMAAAGKGPTTPRGAVPPATSRSKPAATNPETEAGRLRVEIWKVLKAGPSTDPVEVRRATRRAGLEATLEDITRELDAMVTGGRVDRIAISPTVTRYRARFTGRGES